MNTRLLVSTAISALAIAAPAASLAAERDIPATDEIVVVANRAPEPADRVGQQVTVLDAQEIRALQTPVLSQLLATVPGVSFSRNGGVGSATQISIRGAETGQNVVVIDGVRLNDPTATDSSFNFGTLLLGDISRIEVLRGPQSVLWGSQAIGGVINLMTASPAQPFEADFTAEGGSNAWGYGRAGVGGKSDRVTWRAAVGYLNTAGISAFDAQKGGREADGYRNEGANAKANVILTDQLSLDLRAIYTRGRIAIDGFPPPNFTFADDSEYMRNEAFAGYSGLNLDLFGGGLHNRLAVTYNQTIDKSYDPTQTPDVTFSGFGRTTRYEYQGVVDLGKTWGATFGAERETSHMRVNSSFSPAETVLSARIDSVYGQVHGEVLPGLTLTGGLRHDHHDTFGGHTDGQVSAAWKLNGGDTILRASWGQGFKAPSLYQLGSEYGNLALKPESSNGWDAGIEQRLLDGRVVLNAAYFERRTKNQIDFVSCFGGPAPLCPTHPSGGYYDNIDRTKARGVELAGEADLTDAMKLQVNYTYTDARTDVPGAPDTLLPRRPKNEANADLSYVWPIKMETAVAVHYSGERFNDAANTQPLKSYVLWDIRASYPVNETIEVYARIENLFDKSYETIRNYGQLGRAAYAGVRATF